jgi:hypothetical protein
VGARALKPLLRRPLFLLALGSAVAVVAASPAGAATPLDGWWTTAPEPAAELVAHGMRPVDADMLSRFGVRRPGIHLEHGLATWIDLATGSLVAFGAYVVRGDLVSFRVVWAAGPGPNSPPGLTWLRWSIFRDRLTFSPVPGRPDVVPLTARPWVRIG